MGVHQGAPGPCSWSGPGSYPAPSLGQGSPARGWGFSRLRVIGTRWGQWVHTGSEHKLGVGAELGAQQSLHPTEGSTQPKAL